MLGHERMFASKSRRAGSHLVKNGTGGEGLLLARLGERHSEHVLGRAGAPCFVNCALPASRAGSRNLKHGEFCRIGLNSMQLPLALASSLPGGNYEVPHWASLGQKVNRD